MASLTLHQDYTRSEIHDMFDPDSPFTLGSGSWGIWGILKVPNRPSDYVFIVSIGQEISGHAFNESITDEGVLSWQSQPGQTLNEARIVDFINHDESVNSIYLFIRPVTSGRTPYTYLGRLKYLAHDAQSQRPVYFKWQILDRLTPGPTREMTPKYTWPRTDPTGAMSYMTAWTSVPQMAQNFTSTTTCPGAGAGSARSLIANCWLPW